MNVKKCTEEQKANFKQVKSKKIGARARPDALRAGLRPGTPALPRPR